MTLSVSVQCDKCSRRAELRPWFTLTKTGVFRLEGNSEGFYIDGGVTFCDDCAGRRKNRPPQQDTWTEYDSRVQAELGCEP